MENLGNSGRVNVLLRVWGASHLMYDFPIFFSKRKQYWKTRGQGVRIKGKKCHEGENGKNRLMYEVKFAELDGDGLVSSDRSSRCNRCWGYRKIMLISMAAKF